MDLLIGIRKLKYKVSEELLIIWRTVMSNITKVSLAGYVSFKIQEVLNPKAEIEFSNYSTAGGLLELSRQYSTMPNGIKELSAKGLKDSIISIIEKHGTLIKYKNKLPQKELKNLLLNLYMISGTQKEIYFERLFEVLSEPNVAKGTLKAIKYVVDKFETSNIKIEKEDIHTLIDDLIFLLIEFLDYRGHSISNIYRVIKSYEFTGDTYNYFKKIYDLLKSILFKKITDFEQIELSLVLSNNDDNMDSLVKYIDRILIGSTNEFQKVEFEKGIIKKWKGRNNETLLLKKLKIHNLHDTYYDLFTKELYLKIDNYLNRVYRYRNISIAIYRNKEQKVQVLNRISKYQNINLHIKHYNNYWTSDKFLAADDIRFEEVQRINEWIAVIEKTSINHSSYNVLWSILEFLLVDNVHDNKIDTINKNFIPYLGLFYFRKSIKSFFKRLTFWYGGPQQELIDYINNKCRNYLHCDFADRFFYFIYDKEIKDKWYDDLEFHNCSKEYMNYETLKLHNQLHNPGPGYEKFELILKNDLKQMYRFRNMNIHSGILDNRIMQNTFDRLKYYVETLLNSIAYVWLETDNKLENVYEINDLKRIDWADYKTFKNFGVKSKVDGINYVNYKGLVKIPPNRFSFLS